MNRSVRSPLDRLDLVRQVLALLPVGVWIMDERGRIVYGNPAAQQIWGGARYVGITRFGEYRGWWAATGRRVRPREWAAARAIRNGETSLDEEIEIECFDASRKIILNSAMPIRDADGRIAGAIVVNHDITERKRSEEQLRRMAEHDSLTGAWTRRCLYGFLEGELERARRYGTPVSVIMLDIDHFKKVNDTYGHQAGDQVLVRLAATVRRELRAVDLLARYGGEEFVIVTPGIRQAQAAVLAERLRRRIASGKDDALPRITCSFGVCEYRRGSVDDLMRQVDDLLYRAKRAGRDRVVSLPAAGRAPRKR